MDRRAFLAGAAALQFGGTNTLSETSVVSGSGAVSVQHGAFSTAGAWDHTGALAVTGGTAAFSPGGSMTLSGLTVTGGTGTFNAPVTTDVLTVSGGTALFNEATTTQALALSGGILRSAGALVLDGAGSWTGGAYTGPGQLVVESGHTLTIGGAGTKTLGQGTLLNEGTVLWTGGNIDVTGNGSVVNRGLFDAQVSGGTFGDQSSGVGTLTFTNEAGATLRKSGPGLTAIGSSGGVTPNGVNFNNAGLVAVQAGTLSINHRFDGGSVPGSLANTGMILVRRRHAAAHRRLHGPLDLVWKPLILVGANQRSSTRGQSPRHGGRRHHRNADHRGNYSQGARVAQHQLESDVAGRFDVS
jgi:hypothetical protein